MNSCYANANVCGLKSKKSGLLEIIQENKPHLFLLTETQLRCDTTEKIDGYTLYSRIRVGKVGGGVGILVRNDLIMSISSHLTDRNIEIIWVSIRRKSMPPLFVGSYYGRQETTSKNEIEQEMHLLSEEIEERQNEGEVLLVMDGNAKIGLLNEEISRNGNLLKQVFAQTGLIVMNNTSKCEGRITRKKNNNENEYSAIDFILASDSVEKWIEKALIDEDGLFKIKGKKESDHNTICIHLTIPELDKSINSKQVGWNIRAPEEKWEAFKHELDIRQQNIIQIITKENEEIDKTYSKVCKEIDDAARITIGKTTFKTHTGRKESKEIKELKNQKKELKKEINEEKEIERRKLLIEEHKNLQEKTREILAREKIEEITAKLDKIIQDTTGKTFWGERENCQGIRHSSHWLSKTQTANDNMHQMVLKKLPRTTMRSFLNGKNSHTTRIMTK